MVRAILMASVAAGVMLAAQSAIAADAGASGDSPPGATTVPEVIVTAQRRSENLQQVPMAVTSLKTQDLLTHGATNTVSLTAAVPGLVFTTSTIGAQPTIRGVGSRSVSTGNEANVGIYVDGVYQAQPFANIFDLKDIDQLQVLKGPQGTLYGRNATGGAIVITTRGPSFTPVAEINGTLGSFNYRGVDAFVAGPIIADKLAGSLSAEGYKDDGYAENIYLHRKQAFRDLASVHGKLLFKPTDNLQILANAYYRNSEDTSGLAGHPLNGNTSIRLKPNPTHIPIDVLIPSGPYTTSTNFIPKDRVREWGGDLHAIYDLGWADLTGMASYRETRVNFHQDPDVSPLSASDTLIQPYSRGSEYEATLTSKGNGRLKWIFGYDHLWDITAVANQVATGVHSTYGVKTAADAVFGELTWEPIDHLFLTGGLRWNKDDKSAWFHETAPVIANGAGEGSWSSTTPRLVARYEFNPNTSIYVSYSEGFKSGAFDASSPAGANVPVNPEKIKSVEAGIKADLAPNFRINLSAFHYDYSNLQVTVIHVAPNGSFSSSLQNAATAKIDGMEADAQWVINEHWQLSGDLSLLHARFTSFPNASVVVAAPNLSGGVTAVEDVAGNALIHSPDQSGNITLDYHTDLFNGRFDISGSAYFSSRWYADVNNRVYQPGYTELSASATWTAPGDHYYLRLNGTNLNDAKIVEQYFTSTLLDLVAYQRPRTIMVSVGYKY